MGTIPVAPMVPDDEYPVHRFNAVLYKLQMKNRLVALYTYFLKLDITPARRLLPNESNTNTQGLKKKNKDKETLWKSRSF